MPEKKYTFMSACREFFGLKEGQTGLSFGKEVQALTPADRAEITEGLKAQGYDILPPGVAA